ncbi:hypothetical protein RRG08_014096 [Elysia crispata]|uniref:Uncharacterized protein n=1 Tax=Elysia crispata TaxID=231223 RepID=A0AAE1EDA8_9GAST|nr:hypothetical protein RRG08_014096 [Elysia crispata]
MEYSLESPQCQAWRDERTRRDSGLISSTVCVVMGTIVLRCCGLSNIALSVVVGTVCVTFVSLIEPFKSHIYVNMPQKAHKWNGKLNTVINFLACQLVALCVAFPFRSIFSVEKVGTKTRHYIETGVGLLLTLFCFG